MLALLVRNRPKLLTHGTILREVWGPGYSDDSQVLRQQVANLRAKIEPGPGPARAVVTVPEGGLPVRRILTRPVRRRAGS